MRTMIIPIGKTCLDLPLEFQYNKDGWMRCVEALEGLDLSYFDNIYFVFTIFSESKWSIREQLNIQVNRLRQHGKLSPNTNVRLIEIKSTSSQAETVYQTIKNWEIEGEIFIKDADNKCTISKLPGSNAVCVYSIEDCDVVDPRHKSYITIDDNMLVTNMIEKKVVSNYFNCGGYYFEDATSFCEAYEFCKEIELEKHMYLSHIVYYLILFKKQLFRPVIASNYVDFAIEK